MKNFLKITILCIIFIALINVSIGLFNFFNPWLGIGFGAIVIISYICIIIHIVEKYKSK
jgi:hypothetical protein